MTDKIFYSCAAKKDLSNLLHQISLRFENVEVEIMEDFVADEVRVFIKSYSKDNYGG